MECWIHRDRLGASPWSLCFHRSPSEDGDELLTALRRLKSGILPASAVIRFAVSRKGSVGTLHLRLCVEDATLRCLTTSYEGTGATIEFTPVGHDILLRAVEDWLGGAEDFVVSALHSEFRKRELRPRDLESGEIWFWGPTMTP